MAYESYMGGVAITLVAAADLTAKQYHFVKVDSGGLGAQAGDGENAVGVIQNKPDIGQAVTVWGAGNISKVVGHAAVAKGDKVASSSTGRGMTAATGDQVLGTCLLGCANAGEMISVLLDSQGILA